MTKLLHFVCENSSFIKVFLSPFFIAKANLYLEYVSVGKIDRTHRGVNYSRKS